MHRGSRRTKIICIVTAIACLGLIWPVQQQIDRRRRELVQEDVMPRQLPLAAATSAVLGGFRGIAVDILWVQADSMLRKNQFYQLITYYELISVLQPNLTTVWEFNAWNLAYNISAEWGRPEQKWDWIKRGLDFAKKGLAYNEDSPSLNHFIGFIYFHKIGKDESFRRRLSEERGEEAFWEAYKLFQRAGDLALEAGSANPRYRSMAVQALFQHGKAVLEDTGNLPRAMEIFNDAEEQTRRLLAEFPEDLAIMNLLYTIRAEKAKYAR